MRINKLNPFLIALLLSFGLEAFAVREFSCSDLQNSKGLVVKFKSNNLLLRTANKNSNQLDFSDPSLAKKYIKRKLNKKIKHSKKVYRNSKFNSLQNHKNSKFKKRALKYQDLELQKNLNQIYVFEFDFDASQTPSLTALIQSLSAKPGNAEDLLNPSTDFNLASLASCDAIKASLEDLNKDINIEFAEPNLQVSIASTNDPFYLSSNSWNQAYDDLWGLKKINADNAWIVSQGEGMIVAVVDTGVDYNHPDLWDNIWVNPDFANDRDGDGDLDLDDLDLDSNKSISGSEIINQALGYNFVSYNSNPRDDQGHGTHVAGTIAAIRNNGLGIVGVAPKAKILAIKGLDADGSGYLSDLADALVYAAQYADLANNSWGGIGYTRMLDDAFQTAHDLGMINIAAAGNNASDASNFYPAALDTVIAVGSSTEHDYRSSFSNYGSVVDIYAPGGGDANSGSASNILSTMSGIANLGARVSNGYNRLAGTSMASPHVAGVVALLKSQNQLLNQEQIRTIIRNTSSSAANVITIPSGIIDAYAALQVPEALPDAKLIFASTNVSGLIDIRANAKGNNFASYTIDYASGYYGLNSSNVNWQNLLSSSIAASGEIVYEDFDSSLVPDGLITFKLTVIDSLGNSASDFMILTVDNLRVRSPKIETPEYQKAIFAAAEKITINGFLFSNSLINYELEIYDKDNNPIEEDGLIEFSNSGAENLINGKLAQIDASKLPRAGYYKYNLLVNTAFGSEFLKGDFVYEPAIKNGWPKEMLHDKPQWQCSSSVCSRSQSIFWNNFVLADINNDSAKDIFQSYTETRFYDKDGVLPNWDRDDIYFFCHGHIADIDGDDKLEVFGLNRSDFERLTIFENDGSTQAIANNLGSFGQTIMNSADLDGDGDEEMILIANKDFGTKLYVLDKNFSILYGGPYAITNAYNFSYFKPIIEDIDNDGDKEIIFYFENLNQNDNKIFILDPKSGNVIRNWSVDFVSKPLVLADLDADEDFEVISFNSSANSVFVYNHDSSLLTGFPVLLDEHASNESELALGDLNKDGKPEIVISYRVYQAANDLRFYLTAIQGDGNPLAGYPIFKSFDTKDGREHIAFSSDSGFNSPLIFDIDGDGFNEVIVAKEPLESSRSVIQAYDYQANQVENFEYFGEKGGLFFSDNSMAVGDIDGDNFLELVFADFDQDLYLFDLAVPSSTNIEWSMAYGELNHSGVYLSAAQKLTRAQGSTEDPLPEPEEDESVTPLPAPSPPSPAPAPTPPSPAPSPLPSPPAEEPDPIEEEIPEPPVEEKPEPQKPLTPFEESQTALKDIFDKNQDGKFNKKEFNVVLKNFKKAQKLSKQGKALPDNLIDFDLNQDGLVDQNDHLLIKKLKL